MGETAKDRAGGAQDAIRRAVLRLAARKPLHKISVTEICREAPVHRSTFYKYYGSPYDVMGEIRRLLVAHTAESVMHSLQAGANMHDALCNALKYVRENQETVRLLLKLGDYSLFQEVKDQLPDFHSVLLASLPAAMPQAEKQACASFVQFGALHLLLEWVETGCSTSPEEEVALLFSVLGRMLRP